MRRKVLLTLVFLLAVAIIAITLFSPDNKNKVESSRSESTQTTQQNVKVPEFVEESSTDSTAESKQKQIDQNVSGNSLQSNYTLPSPDEPKDNPPEFNNPDS